jgi:hypothetical protein
MFLRSHFFSEDLIVAPFNRSYNLPATLCRNTTVRIEGGTSATAIKFPACSPDTLEEKITIVKKIEQPSVTKKNIIIITIVNICDPNNLSAIVTNLNNSKTILTLITVWIRHWVNY